MKSVGALVLSTGYSFFPKVHVTIRSGLRISRRILIFRREKVDDLQKSGVGFIRSGGAMKISAYNIQGINSDVRL